MAKDQIATVEEKTEYVPEPVAAVFRMLEIQCTNDVELDTIQFFKKCIDDFKLDDEQVIRILNYLNERYNDE